MQREKTRRSRTLRLGAGALIVTASVLLCGSMPFSTGKKNDAAKKNTADDSRFALAVVNDVRQEQRSQLIRLAARYPQLFIQAGAGQFQRPAVGHR